MSLKQKITFHIFGSENKNAESMGKNILRTVIRQKLADRGEVFCQAINTGMYIKTVLLQAKTRAFV